VRKGDFVFFATSEKEENLFCYFIAGTNALPDRQMGSTVFMDNILALKNPLSVFLGEASQRFFDSWGCENFSTNPNADAMYFAMVDLNYFASQSKHYVLKEKNHTLSSENIIQIFLELSKVQGAS
jgi:hypothetical protein